MLVKFHIFGGKKQEDMEDKKLREKYVEIMKKKSSPIRMTLTMLPVLRNNSSSREGKKRPKVRRDNNAGAGTVVGRGEESLLLRGTLINRTKYCW